MVQLGIAEKLAISSRCWPGAVFVRLWSGALAGSGAVITAKIDRELAGIAIGRFTAEKKDIISPDCG